MFETSSSFDLWVVDKGNNACTFREPGFRYATRRNLSHQTIPYSSIKTCFKTKMLSSLP